MRRSFWQAALVLIVSGLMTEAAQPYTCQAEAQTDSSGSKPAVEKPTILKKSITLEAAIPVALAGLKAAKEMNFEISIAVLDRSGLPLVVLRTDNGTEQFFAASQQKAWTTLAFRGTSTRDLFERIKKNQANPNEAATSSFSLAPSVPKALFLMGGVPLMAGKEVVGAVGVAGAVQGIDDDAIAKKAAAVFSDMLQEK